VQWKEFYAHERAALAATGLIERMDRAPELELPAGGALVFPHTLLSTTGHLTAAVARALVRARVEEVLALGVLHGGRGRDAAAVKRAGAGDPQARLELRKVHDGGDDVCADEFSLDNFAVMLELAAEREGTRPPRIHAKFPFLVGDDPASLPGLHELSELAARMPIVATTDPIHHGLGYGTPADRARPDADASTHTWARTCIQTQLDQLARGEWTAFARLAAEVRSDFRDDGPVLGELLRARGTPRGEILELTLVDYAEVLGAPAPTWVAGPLLRMA
jgi:hypothetical protein